MRCPKILLFAFVTLSLAHVPSIRAGHATAVVMQIPTPIRSYGMGMTGVADDADPGNAFYNPANLSALNGVFLTGGYSELMPMLVDDMQLFNIGLAGGLFDAQGSLAPLSIGAAVHYCKVDYGSWWETSAEGLPVAEYDSWERYFRFSVACGLALSRQVHVGFGASAKHWKIDRGSAPSQTGSQTGETTAWAGDVGARLKASGCPVPEFCLTGAIGVSYLNLGGDPEFDDGLSAPLPSQLRAGLGLSVEGPRLSGFESLMGYQPPVAAMSGYIDIADPRHDGGDTVANLGLEMAVLDMLFLRGGYIHDESGGVEDFTYGAGLGLRLWNFMGRLDYARRPVADDLGHENKYGGTVGIMF